jgi:hypothetical protein
MNIFEFLYILKFGIKMVKTSANTSWTKVITSLVLFRHKTNINSLIKILTHDSESKNRL